METLHDVFLAGKTTFGIGGRAHTLVAPTRRELRDALALAKDFPRKLVLGRGSKLLVSDAGFDGLVLDTRNLNEVVFDGCDVWAGAGASLPALCVACAERGLSGLEWACGIPASVGGAITLNAACFGGCIANAVVRVDALDPDGRELCASAAENGFCYHGSIWRGGTALVTGAVFRLTPGTPEAVRAETARVRTLRRATQPIGMRSAGSAFLRVGETGAGVYIERAGLKGFSVGDATVSEKHANFLLNRGAASCKDVKNLLEYIRTEVAARFGVALTCDYIEVGT